MCLYYSNLSTVITHYNFYNVAVECQWHELVPVITYIAAAIKKKNLPSPAFSLLFSLKVNTTKKKIQVIMLMRNHKVIHPIDFLVLENLKEQLYLWLLQAINTGHFTLSTISCFFFCLCGVSTIQAPVCYYRNGSIFKWVY